MRSYNLLHLSCKEIVNGLFRFSFVFFYCFSPQRSSFFIYFSAEAGVNIKPFFYSLNLLPIYFFIFFIAFWMLCFHCLFRQRLGFGKAQLPSRSDRLFQLWRLLLCPFGVKAIQIVVQGFFLKRQISIRKGPLKNVFNKVVLIDGFGIVFTFKG